MSAHTDWSKMTFPTPNTSLFTVVRAAGNPKISLQQLARLISAEPSFTTELLRVANNPFFGVGKEVRTVRQATVFLGTRTVRNLAVAHVVRATHEQLNTGELDGVRFWEDSLRRGTICRLLANYNQDTDPMEAFTVGLIQDIGTVLLAAHFPEHSGELQAIMDKPMGVRLQRERELCGTTHPDVFGRLGRDWGLPRDLIEAIAGHHDSQVEVAGDRARQLLTYARTADIVADVVQAKATGDTVVKAQKVLSSIPSGGSQSVDLEFFLDQVSQEMIQTAKDLGYQIDKQPSFRDLLTLTNQSLVRIQDNYEVLTQQLQEANDKLTRLLHEKEVLTQQLQQANEQLQDANERLRVIACTDHLTQVANRGHFIDCLNDCLDQIRESSGEMTLILLDVDHFKSINDTYGHGVGDMVLKEVARRLETCLRKEDRVGRIGGEEFAVLLPDTSGAMGAVIAERLRMSLCDPPLSVEGNVELIVTASFGGISIRHDQITSADDLLKAADEAMYQSKHGGRNQVSWSY